jgi:NADH-quinone oxidoreductase subunit L
MVAAGTFVLARLFPIFVLSDPARLVLAVITAVTMIGAAIIAFGQSDLKRLLAYSTVSQIAIMLSALAVAPASTGAGPAVLHLLSHALFKSLLFLSIGWLSVLVAGTAAVAMSGGVRHHPELRWPIGIGLLALAGVPPLVGFVSKEYVLAAAHDNVTESVSAGGWIVLISVGLTVVLTAAYCTRAWLVLTHASVDEEPTHDVAIEESREIDVGLIDVSLIEILTEPAPDEAPALSSTGTDVLVEPGHGHAEIHNSARLSVLFLAFLSVVGGLVIFTPLIPKVEPHINVWLAGASLVLILASAAAVRLMTPVGGSGDAAADRLGADRMAQFDKGFGADGVYVAVASQVVQLARIVVVADRQVIDAYVRGTVVATRWVGIAGERAHTHKPSSYLVWLLVGLLAVGVVGVTSW